jgi:ABC-2 type transport system ATP-binding protein
MEILKVNSITKKFGKFIAVDNISFGVNEGKIFGLLGPNGAGKTTTIRMITNIISPDNGSVEIMGKPMDSTQQDLIGYLPEERGLYKKTKVIEQLEYFGRLKGLGKAEANKKAKSWLNKLGAYGWENKKIQELSKGMAQKVQFVSTVLHDPPFMIFDEPFSGFDPINTELLINIMLELKQQGKTIILSTHQMYQVEKLCDEIFMINQGKQVLSGNLREIKRNYGKNHLIIEFTGNNGFLNSVDKTQILDYSDNRAEIKLKSFEESQEILKLASQTCQITKFVIEEPSLNEIFIEIVERITETNTEGESNEKI